MKKGWIGMAAAVGMIMLMACAAQLTGEREVIFPEMMALVVGMWTGRRQPWRAAPLQIPALLTLSAVMGVLLVRYVPLPVYVKIGLGFLFAAGLLYLTNTTFYPIISACVLPILLGTRSWVYPVSVFIMASILLLVQGLLVRLGLRDKPERQEPAALERRELLKWGALALLFLLLAAVPVHLRAYFFIAPPLIVTFVEFAQLQSAKRRTPLRIWFTITLCAVIGTALRLLGETVGVPAWLCAGLAAGLVFAVFQLVKVTFPPAGAIAILPLILESDGLWLYPAEVSLGAAVLICAPMLVFRSGAAKTAMEEIGGPADE